MTFRSLMWVAALGALAAPAGAQEAVQTANGAVQDEAPAGAPATASAAWLEALQTLNPLSPADVSSLREADRAIDEAALRRETPQSTQSDVLSASLEPGAASPVIELLHGFVTSIEVVDATGRPWPVALPRTGDAEAFHVDVVGAAAAAEGGANGEGAVGSVLTVAPARRFAATNMILVLQGQSRPVSVVLRAVEPSASSVFRDRLTLVVQGMGPNARVVAHRGYEHLDAGEDLRAALVGRLPRAGAVEILADLPAGMRAWREGRTLWLRTTDTLISPAPQASVAGGAHRAYRLPYLPVVVTSIDGQLREVSLMERAP